MRWQRFGDLLEEYPDILAMDEENQLATVQDDFINFYKTDAINPYVSLAARGPWIISLKGAVLYDCGGYGMLGFRSHPRHRAGGHEPTRT